MANKKRKKTRQGGAQRQERSTAAAVAPPEASRPKGYTAPKGRATGSRADAASARRTSDLRRTGSWLAFGAVVLAIVAVIGFAVVRAGEESAEIGRSDTSATAWDLPALDGGERVRLADFRGRPVVVNFFASWCTACNAELPEFRAAAQEFDGDVQFVFVNSQEDGDWRDMASEHGIDEGFPLARDLGGRRDSGLFDSLRGRGMPITAFYDADGNLVEVFLGALVGGALPRQLRQLGLVA